jgi:hypothetical protein
MTADPAFTGEPPLLPALEAHLEKGETVRWAARPNVYSIIRTQYWLWWLSGIWFAGAIALLWQGYISLGEFYPVSLVGVAFLGGPFLNLFEGDRTVYAITNKRALIVHNGMRPSFVAVEFSRMDEKLEVLETGSGAGHVYFASNMPAKQRDTDYTGKMAFRNVARAHEVAKILDEARKR